MKRVPLFLPFILVSFFLSGQSLSFIKHADAGHSLLQKVRSTDDGGVFLLPAIFITKPPTKKTTYQSSGIDDIFLAELDELGEVIWLVLEGSSNFDDRPLDMVIDETNEWIYLTGIAGEGAIFETTTIGYEFHSAFLAKYDFEGNLIWVITPGELGGEIGSSISLDQEGNIYISGQMENTATFGNTVFEGPGGLYSNRTFLASYAPDASLRWVKEIGGRPYESQLHVNSQGTILFASSFIDSVRLDSILITASVGNQEDILAARFDTDGNLQGYLQGSGTSRHFVGDIISNSQGDFILGGWSSNTGAIDFGPETLSDAPNFLLTWNGNDPTQLELSNMGTGYFLIRELLLTSTENLLITGMYTYEAALNNTSLPLDYSNEMFLIAYDDNMNPDWYFTGNGGLNDYGTSMCLLNDGSLLLGGYFGDTMRIDSTAIATGTFDINFFLAKFDDVEMTTSTEDVYTELSPVFYPNPVFQEGRLELGELYQPGLHFQLYDGTGKILLKDKIESSTYELDRNGLPEGVYFWQVLGNNTIEAAGKIIFLKN